MDDEVQWPPIPSHSNPCMCPSDLPCTPSPFLSYDTPTEKKLPSGFVPGPPWTSPRWKRGPNPNKKKRVLFLFLFLFFYFFEYRGSWCGGDGASSCRICDGRRRRTSWFATTFASERQETCTSTGETDERARRTKRSAAKGQGKADRGAQHAWNHANLSGGLDDGTLQITAEQIVRDARSQQEELAKPPVSKIADREELAEYQLKKRREFEDLVRRMRWSPGVWTKYAKFEESQQDFERARSVWERALEVDYRNRSMWLKYAEMEMRNRFVNHARNVWDRAVTLLPMIDQFWYVMQRVKIAAMCVEPHTTHVCLAQWNAAIESMHVQDGFCMAPAMQPRRLSVYEEPPVVYIRGMRCLCCY